MRSLFARVAVIGVVGLAMAACATSQTPLPQNGYPNNSGGGSLPLTGNVPATMPPAGTVAARLIDNGREFNPATPAPSGTPVAPIRYSEAFGAASTETQSPLESTSDPAPAPPNVPGTGSHLVTFHGDGLTQVILQLSKSLPDLTFSAVSTAPGTTPSYFAFPAIVLHLAYAPGAVSPGTLASVSLELTGSASTPTSGFDVRIPCKGTPATPPAFAAVTCRPLPALGAVANTPGPSPLVPGATGAFDPAGGFSPRLAIVLNYTMPTPTTATALLGIDNVYATQ